MPLIHGYDNDGKEITVEAGVIQMDGNDFTFEWTLDNTVVTIKLTPSFVYNYLYNNGLIVFDSTSFTTQEFEGGLLNIDIPG
jgi:hypothetical protein